MLDPNKTELLAPAGCFPSLQAAIDAGADAVYFGLAQLNMRAKARRSFELSDLKELMERCHAGGIKGYLTLNTLLYEHDMNMGKKLIEEAKAQGVDAVIASDMSVIQLCQEYGMECHISTQLSISNYQSFKFYAQFSDRIVLARELNLKMIGKLYDQIVAEDLRGPNGRLMEIECFAHGALCIAVSGRCGMSLFTDNASANRGACKQNCRMSYELTEKESGKKLVIDNDMIMSPNDICTIDFMDQMHGAGIRVLKIEGRGRAPEYVYTVIRAYRKALDAVEAGTYDKALVEELYVDLKSVYNRGLSSGYYLGREQGWSGTYGTQATKQKIEVGKITKYFGKIGVAEVKATAGGFKVGDEYCVIGNTTGVVPGVCEEMRLDEGTLEVVKPGDVFAVKVDDRVRIGDRFFHMKEVVAIVQ